MNPDDDRFLSAYIDDELTPEQRQRVDSAMEERPELLERCRGLKRVVDSVAGLSRPESPVDHAPAILDEIHRRRSVFYWVGQFDRPAILKSAALFGSAAALVACAAIGLTVATRSMNGPGADFRVTAYADKTESAKPTEPAVVAESAKPTASPADLKGEAGRPASVASVAADPVPNAELAQVREWLTSPALTERFVVTDVVGGDASAWIGRYLRNMPRRKDAFARLTVGGDTPIDPDHPGAAVVFVVVLDPRERKGVHDDFVRHFRHGFASAEIRPFIGNRLAQLDGSLIEQGTKVANVFVPDHETRARLVEPTPRDEPKFAFVRPGGISSDSVSPGVGDSPTVEPQGAESAKDVGKAAREPAAKSRTEKGRTLPTDESVVLIWVKTRGTNPLAPAR